MEIILKNNISQSVFIQTGHGTDDHKAQLVTRHCLSHLLTTEIYLGRGVGRKDLDVSILYDV